MVSLADLQAATKASIDPRQQPSPLETWQLQPWMDKSEIIVCTGSAGGGKSHLAAEKIHNYMMKYPDTFGLIIRKTRQSLTSSTVLFMESEIIPNWEAMGHDKRFYHEKTKSRFLYPNGSILAYAGLGTREERTRLRSIGKSGGVAYIWVEEANEITEDDFNELFARLRDKRAPWRQIILTTNPDHAQHWINQRLIINNEAKVYYSSAIQNSHNPDNYQKNQLERLTGVLYQRLAKGRWVSAQGLVFEQYRQEKSLIDCDGWELERADDQGCFRRIPPPDWRRVVGVDFGYENPFVAHWYAIDNDENMYLYRELYKSHLLVEDAAKIIKYCSKDEDIECVIADHDAQERATLAKHGIRTRKSRKGADSVNHGIDIVNQRFQNAANKEGHGLYLSRQATLNDAELTEIWKEVADQERDFSDESSDPTQAKKYEPKCFAEELGAYQWASSAMDSASATTSAKERKDVPIKKYDHGCDTSRYVATHVEKRRAAAFT